MMNSPLKWHGGKHHLASKIVALMPPATHYVEPYAGGLSVLFARDPEGVSEVVNDLYAPLTNFWRVLASEEAFPRFVRQMEATPFSERTWHESEEIGCPRALTCVPCAVNFFVRCRQSLAGRMGSFAPLTRNRTRRGQNEQVSAWLTAVEGLPEVHARLKRVAVVNRPALEVIWAQDGPKTLFYLDPPYLDSTRTSVDVYACEMTARAHEDLLDLLSVVKGKFFLSGYRSPLYNEHATRNGWVRHDFLIANHAAGGSTKRRMTECVWTNEGV